MRQKPTVAVVGAGNMGANHVRVTATSPRAELAYVIDVDGDRAEALAAAAGASAATDIRWALECDAVVLAAPTEHHVELMLPLLGAGIHGLVEKPLAADLDDVDTLIAASGESGATLMCGFVERFNPAVQAATELLSNGVHHLLGIRHSPHNPRTRTSVIDDLLIHDIDLALRLMGGEPEGVNGGTWVSGSGVEEVADCCIRFDGGRLATLSSSRASQRKLRSISVSSDDVLVEIDLLRHDLTTYRHRFSEVVDRGGPSYRAETVVEIPFVRHAGEPLSVQFDHFLDLVLGEADREAERNTLRPPHRAVQLIKEAVR